MDTFVKGVFSCLRFGKLNRFKKMSKQTGHGELQLHWGIITGVAMLVASCGFTQYNHSILPADQQVCSDQGNAASVIRIAESDTSEFVRYKTDLHHCHREMNGGICGCCCIASLLVKL